MKLKFLVIIIMFITIITVILTLGQPSSGNLVAPGFMNSFGEKVESSPSPSPTPEGFKFDSSTDLKKELDQVNPQVLDSDFVNN